MWGLGRYGIDLKQTVQYALDGIHILHAVASGSHFILPVETFRTGARLANTVLERLIVA